MRGRRGRNGFWKEEGQGDTAIRGKGLGASSQTPELHLTPVSFTPSTHGRALLEAMAPRCLIHRRPGGPQGKMDFSGMPAGHAEAAVVPEQCCHPAWSQPSFHSTEQEREGVSTRPPSLSRCAPRAPPSWPPSPAFPPFQSHRAPSLPSGGSHTPPLNLQGGNLSFMDKAPTFGTVRFQTGEADMSRIGVDPHI